jgi:phytoene dehydrogenase-like protein
MGGMTFTEDCRLGSSSRPIRAVSVSPERSAVAGVPEKLDDDRVPALVDFIQANEPRLIAFNEYANEEGTEVAVVQVHPDADSMVFHMELIAERAANAYAETVDATTSIQVDQARFFGSEADESSVFDVDSANLLFARARERRARAPRDQLFGPIVDSLVFHADLADDFNAGGSRRRRAARILGGARCNRR